MNIRLRFLVLGGLLAGLCCPAVYAGDKTNAYFSTNTPYSGRTVLLNESQNVMTENSVVLEKSNCSPVYIERSTTSPVYIERSNTSPVYLERNNTSPVLIERSSTSPVLIERSMSSPVMLRRTNNQPVIIEDRIIKQKHAFSVGIWPLFDFEVL